MSALGEGQSKRLTLADAVKGGRNLPSRVVLHGQGGIGKTSWAAHAPDPFFLLSQGETGLQTLIDNGQLKETPNLEILDWENTLSILEDLRTSQHSYKTLVLDVLDGFFNLAKTFVLRTQFKNDLGEKGYGGYSRGDRYLSGGPWRELLIALDRVREEKRMSIICLVHSTISTYKNPAGPDYDRFVPNIYKDAWELTFAWADLVMFGHFDVYAEKLEKSDRKAKGFGGEGRSLCAVNSAIADAKNRHGLVDEIPMGNSGAEGWGNFKDALKAGRNSINTTTTEEK
jgi:hypothetical protein